MGRVNEAMRRASGDSSPVSSVPDFDVNALSAEPYPTETAVLDVPEPPAPPVSVDAPPASPEPQTAIVPSTGRESFVFDSRGKNLSQKVVTDRHMLPASREQYRKLGAALHAAQRANGVKVVMVASAVAGEGKTLTATNLSLTLSESYQKSVLLIDGDLRRPSVHTVFQLEGAPGLTECLASGEDPRLPLHRISDKLTILAAGKASSDPMAGLTSYRMRQLLEEAREVFDWVIIDTPPVGLLTDANLLSAVVDTAIVVVKADHTPHYLVQRAIDAIGKDRVLGVVLNRATQTTPAYGYSYYNAYYGAQLTDGSGS